MSSPRHPEFVLSDPLVPDGIQDDAATRTLLPSSDWEFAEVTSGSEVASLALESLVWRPAKVPGTVALALRALGELDEDRGNHLDEREFLYRRRFQIDLPQGEVFLSFDGLATITEVWLNGRHILNSRNMFRSYAIDVRSFLRTENEILLHFKSLSKELSRKRKRSRWITHLVSHRDLRYLRTTLLGRIPGWALPHPPVGPWGAVRLQQRGKARMTYARIQPVLDGTDGVVTVHLQGRSSVGEMPDAIEAFVDGNRVSIPASRTAEGEFEAIGEIRVPDVRCWWPHNLGVPHRYSLSLSLRRGNQLEGIGTVLMGFRMIQMQNATDGKVGLRVNGRDVFCRGASWTPLDPIGLSVDPKEMRRVLELVRDAGLNMLRVNAAMIYEARGFYDTCDELGILVWQDFMFARMDYPEDDAAFAEESHAEVEQILSRLHSHPCLALLCGSSEVEQQAAMMGLPPESTRSPLFCESIREASGRWCPGLPYLSSSPTGGAMPFHVDAGVAHYFGVGAYLRPLTDARDSRLKFASECLAFSNVPENDALYELFGDEAVSVHAPRYKNGVPRDPGAGWDFSDVTDHYLEKLFRCDCRELRYSDAARYLAMARIAPGEIMERTIGVWRTEDSSCQGALVWYLRDLRPGSGWGILDSAGRPKAPYWFLKRACAPTAIWFTDEGLNGLHIHVQNDTPESVDAHLRISLVRNDGIKIESAKRYVSLEGGARRRFCADALIGRFSDANYAYRFGLCEHVIAVAELVDLSDKVLSTGTFLPMGLKHDVRDDVGLHAVAKSRGDGTYDLCVGARELAMFARILADGFLPSDNYFHVPPGGSRMLILRPLRAGQALRGTVEVLNARTQAVVEIA